MDHCSFLCFGGSVESGTFFFHSPSGAQTVSENKCTAQTERERERDPWSFPRQRFDFTVILPTGVVFVCRNIIAVFSEVLSYLLLTLGAAHSTVAELTASTAQHRR